ASSVAERSSVEREASGSFPLRGASACWSSWYDTRPSNGKARVRSPHRPPRVLESVAKIGSRAAQSFSLATPCPDGPTVEGYQDAMTERLCRFESCHSPSARP